jgi:hypothetical protein
MVDIMIPPPGKVQEEDSLVPFEELITIVLFILRDHYRNQREHVEEPNGSQVVKQHCTLNVHRALFQIDATYGGQEITILKVLDFLMREELEVQVTIARLLFLIPRASQCNRTKDLLQV